MESSSAKMKNTRYMGVKNLDNYFNPNVYVHLFVFPSVHLCVRKLALIPATVSENVTDKSCLLGMHFVSPSGSWDPWGEERHYFIMSGKAKLCMSKHTLVFHHLPSVGQKQLCAFILPNTKTLVKGFHCSTRYQNRM